MIVAVVVVGWSSCGGWVGVLAVIWVWIFLIFDFDFPSLLSFPLSTLSFDFFFHRVFWIF